MPTIFSIVFATEIIDKQPFNVNAITMNHITNNKTSKNLTFIFYIFYNAAKILQKNNINKYFSKIFINIDDIIRIMEKQDILENYIRRIVNDFIQEAKKEKLIRQVIRKTINEMFNSLNEDKEGDSESMRIKRNTVMKLLRNDRLKNSTFAYDIWHPKDQSDKDTARSLFSKKVNGTPDADGNVREFTDEEISKLYELLRGV